MPSIIDGIVKRVLSSTTGYTTKIWRHCKVHFECLEMPSVREWEDQGLPSGQFGDMAQLAG